MERIDVPSWARHPTRRVDDPVAWRWFETRWDEVVQAIEVRLIETVEDSDITGASQDDYPSRAHLSRRYYLGDLVVRARTDSSDRRLWVLSIMVECLTEPEGEPPQPYIAWEATVLRWPDADGDEWELDGFEQQAR